MVCAEKKTVRAAEQDREDVKQKREAWKTFQEETDTERLVFLDECSVNTGMTRLYGRGLTCERVVDAVPDVRFHQTSVLSSVRLDGTVIPCVFEGALNGELFVEYVKKFLAPTLQKGDIVVMDNLSSHKVTGVAEAIEATGAKILFLPPYSPDLNPIELMWSKVKAFLRKLNVRAEELLDGAFALALESITTEDIAGWFAHNGYQL